MAGPPVEVQVRVNVGAVAFSSEVSWNCTEDTTTDPVEEIVVGCWDTSYVSVQIAPLKCCRSILEGSLTPYVGL